ncbi:NADH-quinone oxidoreductase subunit N [Halorubrum ezzemoulense]|uniref:NADH dehydrogenase subunit N n=2 Tax=Halorubrum ezzemoulense TaxID=337243 RepID=A0A256IN77_HALEZ|nr:MULTISPECIES: NADH-quinone oxidoreductase subunit N [Halorubrum]MDB2223629.1 NADH-quinone oxidoreductase subunit N [Halorubrum ezzemoulense]MDB2236586.1 NADH-quinone oxidoreductase subunit N [Halorubrum ezzemoulense]MDB2241057.1 NADH-quinone oxidoreductase subunit N [Halorubrum ezzemoulense]MDB2244756.1 NADH-quinone oxidoreductase subunit N [Halorubrum ezzemoulense]MDB2248126.1 NADH-quinone oxidoreductase subunit N [Halorubrum ezzemoulense]
MVNGLPGVTALLPALLLAVTGLALLLVDTVRPDARSNTSMAVVGAIGSLAALAASVWLTASGGVSPDGGAVLLFADAVKVDTLSLFFTAIFASVTALVLVAAHDYFHDHDNPAAFYSLVTFAATGMALLAVANSLAVVFVALEMVSLPSYVLVAYLKQNRGSVEAGLKYFLVGALSSAIFLFGISLVYAATGSLILADIASASIDGLAGVLGVGVVMMIGGVAFKTASVPFHFWAPEAYEGAPAPVSAFLSSASKAAGFVVAFRVFTEAFPLEMAASANVDWMLAFAILAAVTMTLGNFAAAVQEEVKRMLAYSSIGHAGYALIGVAALTVDGPANGTVMGAAMAHLLVYGFMNTGAFLFVAMAERWGVGRTFADYAGLWRRAPVASVAMAVFMFSLAGLPPFAGFFSKYFLFQAAIDNGFLWLAGLGAINSVVSLYYYSRVVKALFLDDPASPSALDAIDVRPTALYAAVIFAAVATVLLLPGFGPVIETAEAAASALF